MAPAVLTKAQRDEIIKRCQPYGCPTCGTLLPGEAPADVAAEYHISRQRVQQILAAAQQSGHVHPEPRYAFIGTNVSKRVRAAFQMRARQKRKSMSKLLEDLIMVELQRG